MSLKLFLATVALGLPFDSFNGDKFALQTTIIVPIYSEHGYLLAILFNFVLFKKSNICLTQVQKPLKHFNNTIDIVMVIIFYSKPQRSSA